PYNTALYHTIAASIHITLSYGIVDGVSRYNTSLDGLIRPRAVFGARGACSTVPCGLTRLRPSKDGSRPSSMLFWRFVRLPAVHGGPSLPTAWAGRVPQRTPAVARPPVTPAPPHNPAAGFFA